MGALREKAMNTFGGICEASYPARLAKPAAGREFWWYKIKNSYLKSGWEFFVFYFFSLGSASATNSAVIVRLLCGYCAVRAGKVKTEK